jgi:4-amino-4-deoxy-L-arabinose transferase-like glycosyltransferase
MLRIDRSLLLWFGAGLVLFLPFLGNVSLFDGLELYLAEIAREMVVTGDYLTMQYNFEPHYVTAPLFVWLQALSFNIFGVNEFAARLPNALLGAFLLPMLYIWGRRIFDTRFGNYWTLAWMGAILPAVFLKSGMSDPIANVFSFLSIGFLVLANYRYRNFGRIALKGSTISYVILSGLFAGLALLANGPVSVLIIYMVVLIKFMSQRFLPVVAWWHMILHFVVLLVPMAIWSVLLLAHGQSAYLNHFLLEQLSIFQTLENGIEGVPGFHFVVLILGCFPASIFALQSVFNKSGGPEYQREFKRWMLVLLWVVVGIFTLLKMKLIHYSSLAYFPVTYLAALSMYRIVRGEWLFKPWMTRMTIVLAAILSFFSLAAAFIAKNPHRILPFLESRPELRETIKSDFYWFHVECLLGPILLLFAFLFVGQIQKQPARSLYFFFAGVVVLTIVKVVVFVGKFEKLTQQDYVAFLKENRELQAVHQFNNRPGSAIPLFYGGRTPEQAQALEHGAASSIYFIYAVRTADDHYQAPEGFAIFKRKGNFYFLEKQ